MPERLYINKTYFFEIGEGFPKAGQYYIDNKGDLRRRKPDNKYQSKRALNRQAQNKNEDYIDDPDTIIETPVRLLRLAIIVPVPEIEPGMRMVETGEIRVPKPGEWVLFYGVRHKVGDPVAKLESQPLPILEVYQPPHFLENSF